MNDPYQILVKPVITEKATQLQEAEEPQYTFEVQLNANKIQIRRAIEQAFKVRVKRVNTLCMKGKIKRVRIAAGKQPDRKKAIVTLHKGERIDLY
jgi:large subunit ribosomal protein L23